MACGLLSSLLAMRHLKRFSQFSVMWVLVFVMAAGPLPLGIPAAPAAGPAITDVPGLQNFYNPKVFIIFDTSKSMAYRPGDPNDDPTAVQDNWDPNIPTPDTDCRNKFCIGKRALYRTLPVYSPGIEMGLSGYSQYYQLTTRPSTVGTQCRYNKISLGYTPWGTYKFGGVLDDLDGTGPGGPTMMAATPFTFLPPGLPASHLTRKWSVGIDDLGGDIITKNVGNGAGGAGTFLTVPLAHSPPRWHRAPVREKGARDHRPPIEGDGIQQGVHQTCGCAGSPPGVFAPSRGICAFSPSGSVTGRISRSSPKSCRLFETFLNVAVTEKYDVGMKAAPALERDHAVAAQPVHAL